MKLKRLKPILFLLLLASLFTNCAAAGNMIESRAWVGIVDMIVAGAITVYIFRGTSK
ncbi:MAG: hypothetical protein V4539_24200 [Bacteroidota bacterium]